MFLLQVFHTSVTDQENTGVWQEKLTTAESEIKIPQLPNTILRYVSALFF